MTIQHTHSYTEQFNEDSNFHTYDIDTVDSVYTITIETNSKHNCYTIHFGAIDCNEPLCERLEDVYGLHDIAQDMLEIDIDCLVR